MGKMQRDKGRGYELEVRDSLASFSPAERISEAGISVPDLKWMDRLVECRRRSVKTGYQSMNAITAELEGDAALYVTRLDRSPSYVVMTLDTLLDLLDEVKPKGGMRYG